MIKNIFTLVILSLLISCVKDIKKGTHIVVSGFLTDTVKNKNLSFAKVYLVGCKNGFYRRSCLDYLDSAITDANGNFSIYYRAEGKSVEYVLEVAEDNNYSDNLFKQFPFVNNSVGVRLKSQELNFLQLKLKVDYNRYDTLYIYPAHGTGKRLIGRSLDTTLTLKVLPLNQNIIAYRIFSVGNDSGAIFRMLIDTLNIGSADTTTYSKRMQSTYQIPFY